MSDAPETPALDAWYQAHKGRDRPSTRLWFPEEMPYAILQTLTRGGPHGETYLPDPERPTVDVHLGGHIQIGGYLSEMEAYFAAVVEAIRFARWQADQLTGGGQE